MWTSAARFRILVDKGTKRGEATEMASYESFARVYDLFMEQLLADEEEDS